MTSDKAIPELKALIFDMDGVIVDSEPFHLQAWQIVLEHYAVEYAQSEHQTFLGRKDLFMAGELLQRYALPLRAHELAKRKESVYLELIRTKAARTPGLTGLLQTVAAAGLHCGLASSATMDTIKLTVSVLLLDGAFQTITSGDEVEHGKPAPDVFLLAARRLGIEPNVCLVVEDTRNGILAAKSAGMYCVSVPCQTTMHEDHGEADMNFPSLVELDRYLQETGSLRTSAQIC